MDTDSHGYCKQKIRSHLPWLAHRLVPPTRATCKDFLSVFIGVPRRSSGAKPGVHPWL